MMRLSVCQVLELCNDDYSIRDYDACFAFSISGFLGLKSEYREH